MQVTVSHLMYLRKFIPHSAHLKENKLHFYNVFKNIFCSYILSNELTATEFKIAVILGNEQTNN